MADSCHTSLYLKAPLSLSIKHGRLISSQRVCDGQHLRGAHTPHTSKTITQISRRCKIRQAYRHTLSNWIRLTNQQTEGTQSSLSHFSVATTNSLRITMVGLKNLYAFTYLDMCKCLCCVKHFEKLK